VRFEATGQWAEDTATPPFRGVQFSANSRGTEGQRVCSAEENIRAERFMKWHVLSSRKLVVACCETVDCEAKRLKGCGMGTARRSS